MVVLATSICTKAGKPLVSRQFREMPRSRIESLLTSFPTLIPPSSQHTSVETADVRYVYQPLDDLYILLITNKASNILQDIDTLHLVARVVSDTCRTAEEREILGNAFQLLAAFDEIVSMGYREQVNLMQIKNNLEMESHEEKIQDIIARNKEAEAKEELKRRAKQLEIQRREQQRRAGSGGSAYLGGSTSFGGSGYSSVPRFDRAASPAPSPFSSGGASTPLKAPAFKGSGMKLGAAKKVKQAEMLDALGAGGVDSEDISAPGTPALGQGSMAAAQQAVVHTGPTIVGRGSLPVVPQDSVHVQIREQLSLSLTREGGLQSFELKGDLNFLVSDPAFARVKVTLAPSSAAGAEGLQFKNHPNIAKFNPQDERVVALKDPSRSFPIGQPLGVLKWRSTAKDESVIPLSINCWPTPSNNGSCDVNIEYELENDELALHDVVISIPLPAGSYPTVSSASGVWQLNAASHSLDWAIPVISAEHDTSTGTLEFNVGGDDISGFFPVRVVFVTPKSLFGLEVASVSRADNGEELPFSQEITLVTDQYLVV